VNAPTPAPASGFLLDVGDGHQIYAERHGPQGPIAALFLHGGPGSGCQPGHLALFDTTVQQVVMLDQRGAGRSRPKGARHANTTAHLIADIERLRTHLGIAQWVLVGGSWGATLALAYATTHPDRVQSIVLRATFLGTRAELDWAFGTGLAHFHPGLHADFLAQLPDDERADPLAAYWRRIEHPDPAIHLPAARAWHDTERMLSQHRPMAQRLDTHAIHTCPIPSTPFMEAHYFAHDCFLETPLLDACHRLHGIPGVIVQGRYDLLCPPKSAFALAARWPDAQIQMVEGAGHTMGDPGITEAVTDAIARMMAL